MEIWEPKPPGKLWPTPGLLGTPLTLLYFLMYLRCRSYIKRHSVEF